MRHTRTMHSAVLHSQLCNPPKCMCQRCRLPDRRPWRHHRKLQSGQTHTRQTSWERCRSHAPLRPEAHHGAGWRRLRHWCFWCWSHARRQLARRSRRRRPMGATVHHRRMLHRRHPIPVTCRHHRALMSRRRHPELMCLHLRPPSLMSRRRHRPRRPQRRPLLSCRYKAFNPTPCPPPTRPSSWRSSWRARCAMRLHLMRRHASMS